MEEKEQEMQYIRCAMWLASNYPVLLQEHDRLVRRLDGSWIYTKDMAIADLNNITVSFGSERVQTSNISNPSERIALLLTDEYLQKKQEEYNREHERCLRECAYVDWKLDTVETALRERMNDMQRRIFDRVFVRNMTFREIRDSMGDSFCNREIVETKKAIWEQISRELQARALKERSYVQWLIMEEKAQRGETADEKEKPDAAAASIAGRYEADPDNGPGIHRSKNQGEAVSAKEADPDETAAGHDGRV